MSSCAPLLASRCMFYHVLHVTRDHTYRVRKTMSQCVIIGALHVQVQSVFCIKALVALLALESQVLSDISIQGFQQVSHGLAAQRTQLQQSHGPCRALEQNRCSGFPATGLQTSFGISGASRLKLKEIEPDQTDAQGGN